MKIKNVKCTCSACPSQWEIILEDGRMIYVRYRWGCLSMTISEKPTDNVSDAVGGKELFYDSIGDDLDGCLSYDELKPYLTKAGIVEYLHKEKSDDKNLFPPISELK